MYTIIPYVINQLADLYIFFLTFVGGETSFCSATDIILEKWVLIYCLLHDIRSIGGQYRVGNMFIMKPQHQNNYVSHSKGNNYCKFG